MNISLYANTFANIDLLSVGIAIAATLILGFIIFFSNNKSITNRSFLFFSFAGSIYSIINYISYQTQIDETVLIVLRLVIFSAVWYAFSLFFLVYVFPLESKKINNSIKYILFPIVLITSILNLTPLVFKQLLTHAEVKTVAKVQMGEFAWLFILLSVFLISASFILLILKTFKAKKEEKVQLGLILIGSLISFTLIIIFNLLFPLILNNVSFVKFAPVFIFPFVVFTFYAIYKHHLFNIKNTAIVIVAFALTVATFIEIIFADSLSLVIFRVSIFILVLIFSIQLVRNIFNLEIANNRLKELDEMKTEFVSLATHQIRAPLTAIKGYISLIQEGDYGPVSPEINGAIDVINQSTNNLVTIVGDFLDVSRIEQNRMKYDFSDFDVQKLAEQIVTEYKPNVEKKGLEFHYAAAPGNYMIHGDMGKIKQVIGNIIDNSIKYTPKGRIDMSVAVHEGKILIEIADTGVGIPAGTIPKLFQKFTRAENANEANILGTGLGLYVAKQMIEANHGRVWAESEGQNKGSQFYIELNSLDSKSNTSSLSDINPFAEK